jgi:hypothetical protein
MKHRIFDKERARLLGSMKLKPCPFCGSDAWSHQYITEGVVMCENSLCRARIIKGNVEQAIKWWNWRTYEH